MERRTPLLAGLLAVQLLIIAAITFWQQDAGGTASGPLLTFDRATVDRLHAAGARQARQDRPPHRECPPAGLGSVTRTAPRSRRQSTAPPSTAITSMTGWMPML